MPQTGDAMVWISCALLFFQLIVTCLLLHWERKNGAKQKDSILWQFCCTFVYKKENAMKSPFFAGKYNPCLLSAMADRGGIRWCELFPEGHSGYNFGRRTRRGNSVMQHLCLRATIINASGRYWGWVRLKSRDGVHGIKILTNRKKGRFSNTSCHDKKCNKSGIVMMGFVLQEYKKFM